MSSFEIINATPDGKCFWHCLEYIFSKNHSEIKNAIKNFIENASPELLLELGVLVCLDNYEYWKSRYLYEIDNCWGGDVELNIISYLLNMRFIIYETLGDIGIRQMYGFNKNGIKIIDKRIKKNKKIEYHLHWAKFEGPSIKSYIDNEEQSKKDYIPNHWDLVGMLCRRSPRLSGDYKTIPYECKIKENTNEWIKTILEIKDVCTRNDIKKLLKKI